MHRFLLLIALVVATCAPTRAQATLPFTDLVVFGDSLSDNGNLFALTGQPPPPYFQGRFSNGPVWVEQLVPRIGVHNLRDQAVGGADSADVLNLQVVPYVTAAGGQLDPRALYVVWVGANDLLPVLANPAGAQAAIANAMTNIGNSLGALVGAGARHVMVVNLPDLGATPRAIAAGPVAQAGGRALTIAFNDVLNSTLALVAVRSGRDLVLLDVFAAFDELVAAPWRYEFANVTQPALTPTGIVPNPNSYAFWDDIHPTTAGHNLVMQVAVRQLRRAYARRG